MKDTSMRIGKTYIVDWVDSNIVTGGEYKAEEIDFRWVVMSSIGFLAKEDIESVILAQDYRAEEETYRTFIVIPKVCIVNYRDIRVSRLV